MNAKTMLISKHLKYVVNIARQYIYFGFDILDLIEEGNIALMAAVDKFDTNYIERRKKFNKMSILNSDEMNFVNEVIDLIYLGLQEREYNEENLLKKVREMRKYNEKSRFMVL